MNYGLVAALVVGGAAMIATIPGYVNPPSTGFWLIEASPAAEGPWEPLVLFIDPRGGWHLDGKAVSPKALPGELKRAFGHRTDWTVFVDASPGLEIGQVIRAMDVMAGVPAKVILAPASRGAWRRT